MVAAVVTPLQGQIAAAGVLAAPIVAEIQRRERRRYKRSELAVARPRRQAIALAVAALKGLDVAAVPSSKCLPSLMKLS